MNAILSSNDLPTKTAESLMREGITIAAYHDISGERNPFTDGLSISTRPEVFRKHVAYFAKEFDIIGVDNLLRGPLPRKPMLITFDDAYRSVLTDAAPVLKEFKAPAVFFLIASVPEDAVIPMDNVLSFAVAEIGALRMQKLLKAEGTDAISVGDLIARFIAVMPLNEIMSLKSRILSELGMTEMDLRRASTTFLNAADMIRLGDYGIDIGNHSMSHSHFRNLSRRELEVEIVQSRRQLQSLSGQPVRSLSIPYGNQLDATRDALFVARESGHDAIFLVQARSNRFRPSEDIYYRVSLRNEANWTLPLRMRVIPMLRSLHHVFRS